MSELRNDAMERDSELTAIYRAAATDAPPPALDDAIRAAARRAVGSRPHPAGFGFGPAWRVPLSIAAVLVLSVSIVTLMREESPELTESPRAVPPAAEAERKPVAAEERAAATPAPSFVPDAVPSKKIGLKPPSPASSGLGMRPEPPALPAPLRKETVADRAEADERGKRSDAPASIAAQPAGRANTVEQSRQPAQIAAAPPPAAEAGARGVVENKTQASPDAASVDRAERRSRMQSAPAPLAEVPAAPAAPAPAVSAKAASQVADASIKAEHFAGLPPEKWLERIEQLRKEGKFDEAKARLAEFRKRYPSYRLPDSLREWSGQ